MRSTKQQPTRTAAEKKPPAPKWRYHARPKILGSRPAQLGHADRWLGWDDLFARGLVTNKVTARTNWEKGLFVKPMKIGQMLVWSENEIEEFLAAKKAERDAA